MYSWTVSRYSKVHPVDGKFREPDEPAALWLRVPPVADAVTRPRQVFCNAVFRDGDGRSVSRRRSGRYVVIACRFALLEAGLSTRPFGSQKNNGLRLRIQ
jgi:hypothetical protein